MVSTTETAIKGARERSVATQVTQWQHRDAASVRSRRTVTMDEANQDFVADDPQDEMRPRPLRPLATDRRFPMPKVAKSLSPRPSPSRAQGDLRETKGATSKRKSFRNPRLKRVRRFVSR